MVPSVIKTESMLQIQAADPSTVRALGESMPLGPIDSSIAVAFPIPVCFVYRTRIDTARLQAALRTTLNYYPHLTGRLTADLHDKRHLHRFGTGAELVLAACTGNLSDATDASGRLDLLRLSSRGWDLLPDQNPDLYQHNPLLTVQYTAFADGSILSIRIAHAICDGIGFFQFTRHLVEMSNTGRIAGPPPVIRAFCPSEGPGSFTTKLHSILPGPAVKCGGHHGRDEAVGRYVHLDKAYLERLKARATLKGGRISTFTAVVAHVYQVLNRARRMAEPSRTRMAECDVTSAVNIRGMTPNFPANYFPNAVFAPFVRCGSATLCEADLRDVAAAVQALTRTDRPPNASATEDESETVAVDPRQIDQTIAWLQAQSDLSRVRTGVTGGKHSLIATQWTPLIDYKGHVLNGAHPILIAPSPHLVLDGLLMTLPAGPPGSGEGNDGLLLVLAWTAAIWGVVDQYDMLGYDNIGVGYGVKVLARL